MKTVLDISNEDLFIPNGDWEYREERNFISSGDKDAHSIEVKSESGFEYDNIVLVDLKERIATALVIINNRIMFNEYGSPIHYKFRLPKGTIIRNKKTGYRYL